jgi:hypothetical protein
MPISGGTDAYSIAFGLLGAGGIGAIITKIYDHWMTKRQERIDMARIRLDTISKAAPYYSRLAVYNCWNLASLLRSENETPDFELMFYYLCNILYLRHKIIQTFGEIQLDNLEAEEIIGARACVRHMPL